jgi:hypothetical protein
VLTLRRFMRAHGECLGCWKSGETLRAELDAVEQPVSEHLAAMLKELERPTAT